MDHRSPYRKNRYCERALALGACILILLIVLGIWVGIAFGDWRGPPKPSDFRKAIVSKCKDFLKENGEHPSGDVCEKVWDAFSSAYVGKDPCDVPMAAYDPLIQTVSEKDACNRTLLWSKTKDIIRQLTAEERCLLTLEDTLLGFLLKGRTWCSKAGRKKTFTTGCPGWMECERNPVRSFWTRASAAFAEAACGEVTAMLNGSIDTPFTTDSIFSNDVKRLRSPRVRALNVILVTTGNDTATCENNSLQNLRGVLDPGVKYTCKEVQRSKILECISDPDRPCGACW